MPVLSSCSVLVKEYVVVSSLGHSKSLFYGSFRCVAYYIVVCLRHSLFQDDTESVA